MAVKVIGHALFLTMCEHSLAYTYATFSEVCFRVRRLLPRVLLGITAFSKLAAPRVIDSGLDLPPSSASKRKQWK